MNYGPCFNRIDFVVIPFFIKNFFDMMRSRNELKTSNNDFRVILLLFFERSIAFTKYVIFII